MTTAPATSADHELMLRIYATMVRINEADKAIQRGLSAGELQFQYYPAGGQEAIPAGIEPHLRREDYAVITYRCIHDIVAKGTPLREIMAEMYGRSAGTSKGKGGDASVGPAHRADGHHRHRRRGIADREWPRPRRPDAGQRSGHRGELR
jgi:TPP-dependent pyruvate/acetoin dehydrogenase alpha subunit